MKDYKNSKNSEPTKLGPSVVPDKLKAEEQRGLFEKLDALKKNHISKDSEEYKKIRNLLVEHNMKLAMKVASSKGLINLGIERKDLLQMAMEELIKAVDNYDISLGNEFSSYAVPTIYYGIKSNWRKGVNNNGELEEKWQKLKKLEEKMLKNSNRLPTDEEIKKSLRISYTGLKNLKKYMNYHSSKSLDENDGFEDWRVSVLQYDEGIGEIERKPISNGIYVDENESVFEGDTREVEIAAQIPLIRKEIEDIFEKILSDKEIKVLKLIFGWEDGSPKTLREIGNEFNVTKEAIRQVKEKALKKLRRSRISKDLRVYLDFEFCQYAEIYEQSSGQRRGFKNNKTEQEGLNEIANLLEEVKKLDERIKETGNRIAEEKKKKKDREKNKPPMLNEKDGR